MNAIENDDPADASAPAAIPDENSEAGEDVFSLQRVAYHEAGHLVVGFYLGLAAYSNVVVDPKPNDSIGGYVKCYNPFDACDSLKSLTQGGAAQVRKERSTHSARKRREVAQDREAIHLLAGGASLLAFDAYAGTIHDVHSNHGPGWGGDLRKLRSELNKNEHSLPEEYPFPSALSECFRLVHELWPAIVSVAEVLTSRGSTPAHDLIPIVFARLSPAQRRDIASGRGFTVAELRGLMKRPATLPRRSALALKSGSWVVYADATVLANAGRGCSKKDLCGLIHVAAVLGLFPQELTTLPGAKASSTETANARRQSPGARSSPRRQEARRASNSRR